MRLNKRVESKFKYRYNWVMEDIRASLLVIAAISVALNTMSSPILGLKALIIFIVSGLAAYCVELVYFMFAKELEFSAAREKVKGSFPEVIGITFALLIPIGTPLYAIIISLALGIFVAKIAFGGFSHNIFNVAAVSAVICYVSWPEGVSPILSSNYWLDYILLQISDLLQTPLWGVLAMPEVVTVNAPANAAALYPTWSVFTNNPQVMLGLIPTIIVLPIGIRLILNDAIDYKIPLMISSLSVVGGFIISFFMHGSGFIPAIMYGFDGLFGTILLFVALFVANDPVTSPDSTNTQFIYSMIIVIVTLYIREVSVNVEGVLYAIIFANMFVPLLNANSNKMVALKKKQLLAVASVIFIMANVFIGYNSNLEASEYKEYDHYSINRNLLTCEAVDGETSASVEEVAESEEPVDGEASASVEGEPEDGNEGNASSACTPRTTESPDVDAEASATEE